MIQVQNIMIKSIFFFIKPFNFIEQHTFNDYNEGVTYHNDVFRERGTDIIMSNVSDFKASLTKDIISIHLPDTSVFYNDQWNENMVKAVVNIINNDSKLLIHRETKLIAREIQV